MERFLGCPCVEVRTDQLEEKIEFVVNELKIKKFNLHIHPYVDAYLSKGVISKKSKWKRKYNYVGKIIPSENIGFLQFKFYDLKGNEINLKQEDNQNVEKKPEKKSGRKTKKK